MKATFNHPKAWLCMLMTLFALASYGQLAVNPAVNHMDCGDSNAGSISLSVSGGTSPYTYKWSNASTASAISGLAAGIYTATVYDNAGDSLVRSMALGYRTVWDELVKYEEDSLGRITAVHPSGLYDNYAFGLNTLPANTDGWLEYSIAAGDTVQGSLGFASNMNRDQTSMGYGFYIYGSYLLIQAYTISGTPFLGTYTKGNAYRLRIQFAGDSVSFIQMNGTGTILAKQTYAWLGESGSAGMLGMVQGNRVAAAYSSFDCSRIRITFNTAPVAHVHTGGSIIANVRGGASPYSYLWSNAATTKDLNNIGVGDYTLVVTDDNSATASKTAFLGAYVSWDTLINIVENPDKSLTSTAGSVPSGYYPDSYGTGLNTLPEDTTGILLYEFDRTAQFAGIAGWVAMDTNIGLPVGVGLVILPNAMGDYEDDGLYFLDPYTDPVFLGDLVDSVPLNLKFYKDGDSLIVIKNGVVTMSFYHEFHGPASPLVSPFFTGAKVTRATCSFVTSRPLPPSVPEGPRSVCTTDTMHIFVLDSIRVGSGGDKTIWSYSSSFAPRDTIDNYDSLHVAVGTGEGDTLWMRSLDSGTGLYSKPIQTILLVNAIPVPPVVPAALSVCSDTAYTLVLDSLQTDADSIEWSYDYLFGTSYTALHEDRLYLSAQAGITDTIFVRSKHVNGCVSNAATFIATVKKLPIYPDFHPLDTLVCPGATTDIQIDTTIRGLLYYLQENTSIVDSAWGNDSTAVLQTGTVNALDTFYLVTIDTSTHCERYDALEFISRPPTDARFTWGDTLLETSDSAACFFAEAVNGFSAKYSVIWGSATIDSVSGCLSHIDSSFTIQAITRDALGCAADTAYISVKTTNVGKPEVPSVQPVYTDTSYTFAIDSIMAGANADSIEWSLSEDFSDLHRMPSPGSFSLTLPPNSDTLVWVRSRNSATNAVGKAKAIALKTNKMPQSVALLDKGNWEWVWGDEFNNDVESEAFSARWENNWNSLDECGRTIFCPGYEIQLYANSEVFVQNGILHMTARTMPAPINVTCDCNGTGTTRQFKYTSGELISRNGPDDTNASNGGCWEVNDQFYLGMFEIRCKLPKGKGAWPAFWLWNRSEIDIMEVAYGDDESFNKMGSHIHDWDDDLNCVVQDTDGDHCGHDFLKVTPYDYTDDFHTYSCVWSGNKVVYFIDGKEIWSETALIPHPQALGLILNLAIKEYTGQPTFYDMEVDYVRVYKPTSINTTSQCFQNLVSSTPKTLENTSGYILVKNWQTESVPTTVVANVKMIEAAAGDTKIYYVGQDQRCYNTYWQGGKWYEYPLMWEATDVKDNLVEYDDRIYYRSIYNKIKYFKWNNILQRWENFNTPISGCLGNIAVNNAGTLIYRGIDRNIYAYDEGQQPIPLTHSGNVKGGIVYASCGCIIFYQDYQNNLRQLYWWDTWHEVAQPVVSSQKVSSEVVLDEAKGRVFFIGTDGKMYLYNYNYDTNNPGGLVNLYGSLGDDNAVSNLAVDSERELVYYRGNDGKIWYYYQDFENTQFSVGWHKTCLNFYNGPAVVTIEDGYPLVIDNESGIVYFSNKNKRLFSTSWVDADIPFDCDNEPSYQYEYEVYKHGQETQIQAIVKSDTFSIAVFPNPSEGLFNFDIQVAGELEDCKIRIENLTGGICVFDNIALRGNVKTNYTWNAKEYPAGIYVYKITVGDRITTGKILKL